MSERGLRVVLRIVGGTAAVMGAHGVVTGLRGVLGSSAETHRLTTAPNADSEFRFFAAWYAAGGALMLHSSRRPESEAATIGIVSGGWLLAAVGRLLSVRAVGRPHPFFRVLTAVEFAIPGVLMVWQRSVAKRTITSGMEPSTGSWHR